ncbi:acyl-CoA desaturase [Telmatocola sphagniphila]|nr:acyl-CoA desaturase [Telmatocola sphagniphila]
MANNMAVQSTLPSGFFARNINKVPFILLHLAVVAVFFVPVTWDVVALCVGLYVLRMFGITAGYHRYFSHRAYKTNRFVGFMMGWIGASALQKGPLWWAANHRDHHKYSDQENDPHSPIRHGLWWSHVGWVLDSNEDNVDLHGVKDFLKYPEILLLEKFHYIPAFLLGVACYLYGYFTSGSGWSAFVWGFVISTVVLYHGTFLVNSLCHVWGSRRFATTDQSRNNALVAIVTLGEGWHNNHHHYMSSANQGFYWWEIDISYYTLKVMNVFGLVWDLRKPPAKKMIPTTN